MDDGIKTEKDFKKRGRKDIPQDSKSDSVAKKKENCKTNKGKQQYT